MLAAETARLQHKAGLECLNVFRIEKEVYQADMVFCPWKNT